MNLGVFFWGFIGGDDLRFGYLQMKWLGFFVAIALCLIVFHPLVQFDDAVTIQMLSSVRSWLHSTCDYLYCSEFICTVGEDLPRNAYFTQCFQPTLLHCIRVHINNAIIDTTLGKVSPNS